jgi:hypothetical protein
MSLAVILFPDVIGARLTFYRETIMPGSEYSETRGRVWDYPVGNLLAALSDPDRATGHGIGTGSLGVQYVSRILEVPPTNIGVENGYGALIVELGILGPILWLAWALSLVFATFKVVLKLKGTWAFPVGFSILWYMFLILFPLTWGSLVVYQNFVMNAYLWLLVGVLFRLPALVSQDSAELQVTSGRAR